MAANPFLGDALRPDQSRAAHLNLGMFSPMWLPFMAAASVGAAWWTVQNWPRLMGGVTGGNGSAAGQTGAARNSAQAASVVKSYQPQSAQPAAGAANDVKPAPAQVAPSPAASTITESLAVQGDETPAPAPKPRAKAPDAPAATAQRTQAPEAQPEPKKAAPKAQPAVASASHDEGKGEHVKPEPELPPHEGLPARKKSGGGGKKKS